MPRRRADQHDGTAQRYGAAQCCTVQYAHAHATARRALQELALYMTVMGASCDLLSLAEARIGGTLSNPKPMRNDPSKDRRDALEAQSPAETVILALWKQHTGLWRARRLICIPPNLDGFMTIRKIISRSRTGLAPTAVHIRTSEPPRRLEPFHRLEHHMLKSEDRALVEHLPSEDKPHPRR